MRAEALKRSRAQFFTSREVGLLSLQTPKLCEVQKLSVHRLFLIEFRFSMLQGALDLFIDFTQNG